MSKPKSDAPYDFQTSQETDAIARAAAFGKSGKHWKENEQSEICFFEMPALSHSVSLSLDFDDAENGGTLETLKALIERQDSDFIFAMLYIMRLMADAEPTPEKPTANVTVVMDEVIAAVGFDPRSKAQRAEMRHRVWGYIQFGKFAKIRGQRTGSYRDPQTKEVIDTYIECVPWAVVGHERPAQAALWGEVPVSVQLAPSNEWMRLVLAPATRQYLPMAEKLGAIPAAKAAGAWARCIGLALANFWRRQPRSALDGSILQTRAEILERYPASVGSLSEILSSPNPRRAIDNWCDALAILVERGFLAPFGEATRTYKEQRESLPRQDWRDEWLNAKVDLRPGPMMQEAVERVAKGVTDKPLRRIAENPQK